jgi:hypothetical protein
MDFRGWFPAPLQGAMVLAFVPRGRALRACLWLPSLYRFAVGGLDGFTISYSAQAVKRREEGTQGQARSAAEWRKEGSQGQASAQPLEQIAHNDRAPKVREERLFSEKAPDYPLRAARRRR